MFPEIEPYSTGYLKVSDVHEIYYEEVGNPNGKPALYLHGGPGGNIDESCRRLFDSEFYRIILFDQRGAGKSKPFASFEDNTTNALIEDIEKLRISLGIDTWLIYGGSWGSTLALLYSIAYPNRVRGLVLRGIFLARNEDIEWLFQEGASKIFPDKFEEYHNFVGGGNIAQKYYEIFNSNDEKRKYEASEIWTRWEYNIMTIDTPTKLSDYSMAHSFFECHYTVNKFFIEEDYILKNIEKIVDIPLHIIHGRYDMDCRVEMAWKLHKSTPKSIIHIIPKAGHSMSDEGMREMVISCIEDMKKY